MTEIEALAKGFADAYDLLATRVRDLTDTLEAAKRARIKGLKNAVAAAAQAKSELAAAIDANRGLFEQPRTVVFHGVKVGLQKGKGGIEFADEDAVVKRIERALDELPAPRR